MSKQSHQDESVTGIFINSKNIENNGEFVSEGILPFVNIHSDNYSGKGSVRSIQTIYTKEKWHQKWWVQLAFMVISGLLVAYLIYIFEWN